MVISSYGDVRVWEIGNVCRLVVSTSAAHLAAPGASLLHCSLYNGIPQLAFTNSRAYIYHKEIGKFAHFGKKKEVELLFMRFWLSRNLAISGRQSGSCLEMVRTSDASNFELCRWSRSPRSALFVAGSDSSEQCEFLAKPQITTQCPQYCFISRAATRFFKSPW